METRMPAVRSTPTSRTKKPIFRYMSVDTSYDPGQAQAQPEHAQLNTRAQSKITYEYKPTALRPWFLMTVAAFLLGCVALTEYAIRSEPTAAEVYDETRLSARDNLDIETHYKVELGPASWGGRLSPKGMPLIQMARDEPGVIPRVPGPNSFLTIARGHTTFVTGSGSRSTGFQTSLVSTSETVTSQTIVRETITVSATSSTTPAVSLPATTDIVSKNTAIPTTTDIHPNTPTANPEPIHSNTMPFTVPNTSSDVKGTTLVIPGVVSISAEQTVDSAGHSTTLFHTTTLQPASTITQLSEEPSSTKPLQTVAIIPEVTSVSTERTVDSAGHSTTLLHTATLQPATTITQLFNDPSATEPLQTVEVIPEVTSVSTERTVDAAGHPTTLFHTATLQLASTITKLSQDPSFSEPFQTIEVIPGVFSISTEKTVDSAGHPTTILHTSTLQAATTITRPYEFMPTVETPQTDGAGPSPPMVTTFTATLRASELRSMVLTIPAVLSTSFETTEDSDGHPTTMAHTSTIQAASTITQLYEVTPASGQSFFTTVITSTIADDPSILRETLVEETITIPGVVTQVQETTTNSLGSPITTLIDSTLPARTITAFEVSDLPDNTPQATGLALETQQQRVIASSAASPDVMVLVSTVRYATVIPTSVPTVVPTPSNGSSATGFEELGLTTAQYFSGAFLPTVLAVIASLFIEVVGNNAKLMQPFLALASSPAGATAESSILLSFDAWFGAMVIPQAIRLKQPLILITQVVVIGAQVIAPLSAEAVQIYTPSSCTASCYGMIAVQRPVARALQGLLAATAILLVMIVVLAKLMGWKTGVNHNPWSVAGMASLCGNPEIRELFDRLPRGADRAVDEEDIAKALDSRRYMLGHFEYGSRRSTGELSYGLVLDEDETRLPQNRDLLLQQSRQEAHAAQQAPTGGSIDMNSSPWLRPLTWRFRFAFVAVIAGVLAIVTYYQKTTGDSGFEIFMDSRGFGVRFLFTGLGVLLGVFMGAIFECVALITPYLRLSQRALPAERSVLLSTPTNALSGLASAYRQRSPVLGLVSFTTILAKVVLPVALDQVPFAYNSTWLTQQICAWLSVAILAIMIIVVTGLSFVQWPPLPVDPSTVAGAMFYIVESTMVDSFDGLSCKGKKERNRDIRLMASRYAYWQTADESGLRLGRPRVDAYDWKVE